MTKYHDDDGVKADTESVKTDCSTDGTDEVIVEGLLIEDRGEGKEIEHWCIVTNDFFRISPQKGAPPSISIPFSFISEAQKSSCSDRLKALHRQLSSEPSLNSLEPGRKNASDVYEEPDFSSVFLLRTRPTHFHWLIRYGGQYKLEYKLVAQNEDMCNWWIEGINSAIEYQSMLPPSTPWERFRKSLKMSYGSDTFQIFVAVCIFANFFAQAVEAQVLPEPGTNTAQVFSLVEGIFLIIFCFELGINMLATLFLEFLCNGWNFFDVVVIGTSVWSTFFGTGGAGTGVLRLLRAGKAIRLFTRLPSLRKILHALYESIPAMTNAMLLTGLVMCMYGVMGVSFFSDHDNFKSFDVAVFTLFQASTGDGWSDIVRDVYDDPQSNTMWTSLVSVYFVSYMIIVALILMQVVIAVLLEEFSKVSDSENQKVADMREQAGGTNFTFNPNPFESLAQDLLVLCRDEESLHAQIRQVFGAVTSHCKKTEEDTLTFEQLHAGLKALKMRPPALITRREWHRAVVARHLCDGAGRIGQEGFVEMVRHYTREHILTEMTKSIKALQLQGDDKILLSLLCATKTVLVESTTQRARTPPFATSLAPANAALSHNGTMERGDVPPHEGASVRMMRMMVDLAAAVREEANDRRHQLAGMAADIAAVVEEVAALRTQVSSIAPREARESKATLGDLVGEDGADGTQGASSCGRASRRIFLPAESRPANTSSGSGAGAAATARVDPIFSWRSSLGGSKVREDEVTHSPGLRSEGGAGPNCDNSAGSSACGAAALKQEIEPSPRKRIPAREGPSNRKGLHTHDGGTQQTPSSSVMADGEAAAVRKAGGLDGRGDTAFTQPAQNLNEEVGSEGKGQLQGVGVGFAPAWHATIMEEEDDDTYADLMTSPRTERSLYEV